MYLILGLLIAIFGTPALSPLLSAFTSVFGFGLIWWQIAKMQRKRARFVVGFVCYALIHGVAISWMATPFYHGTYIIFFYAILVALFAAQFGALCVWFSKARVLHLPSALAGAGGWVLLEYSRHFILCGYSWNPLGLSLTYSHVPMQLAAMVGVYGLSLVVVLTNLFFARWKLGAKGARIPFVILALSPYLYGGFVLYLHNAEIASSDHWRVALVQTGLEIEEKYTLGGMEERYMHPILQWKNVISELSKLPQGEIDLIALPECAFPMIAHAKVHHPGDIPYLFDDWHPEGYISNYEIAQKISTQHSADVVFGIEHVDDDKTYNTAMLITPEGKSEYYAKKILFPLAEALPFETLRPIASRYGIFNFFTPGNRPKVLHGKGEWIASICYEEMFGNFTRSSSGDMIVNLSNDGWYHHSMLPLQHYIHGRVRAVENGVPMVRACNTGVTAAVDCLGREIASLGVENRDRRWIRSVLIASVPKYRIATFYSLVGDFPVLLLSFCMLLAQALRKSCSKN